MGVGTIPCGRPRLIFDWTLDYGFSSTPLAVALASFTAADTGNGVALAWETVSEIDHLGFNLYRSTASSGSWTRLNDDLIVSSTPGCSGGIVYEWLDRTTRCGITYWYQLESVDIFGNTQIAGDISTHVGAARRIWVPMIMR